MPRTNGRTRSRARSQTRRPRLEKKGTCRTRPKNIRSAWVLSLSAYHPLPLTRGCGSVVRAKLGAVLSSCGIHHSSRMTAQAVIGCCSLTNKDKKHPVTEFVKCSRLGPGAAVCVSNYTTLETAGLSRLGFLKCLFLSMRYGNPLDPKTCCGRRVVDQKGNGGCLPHRLCLSA